MMARTTCRGADDAKRREQERVAGILERDAATRAANEKRETANREIAQGRFVNLADTVDTLPDEQLAGGDFVPVEVDNPEGTVRDRRQTIRRVTRITALHQRGVIDGDGYAACLWYTAQYEAANFASIKAYAYDDIKARGPQFFANLPRTEIEIEARENLITARQYIPDDVYHLFEAIVINDMTLSDAAKMTKCRYANAAAAFNRAVLGLVALTAPLLTDEWERQMRARYG